MCFFKSVVTTPNRVDISSSLAIVWNRNAEHCGVPSRSSVREPQMATSGATRHEVEHRLDCTRADNRVWVEQQDKVRLVAGLRGRFEVWPHRLVVAIGEAAIAIEGLEVTPIRSSRWWRSLR